MRCPRNRGLLTFRCLRQCVEEAGDHVAQVLQLGGLTDAGSEGLCLDVRGQIARHQHHRQIGTEPGDGARLFQCKMRLKPELFPSRSESERLPGMSVSHLYNLRSVGKGTGGPRRLYRQPVGH